MKNLSTQKRFLFSEVIKLIKTILIAPATNTISERSFSTLKRVKTSIRSTVTDSRLNELLLIHIYKEELDEIDIKLITNEFIKGVQNCYFWAVSILTICLFWFIYCYCLTHFFSVSFQYPLRSWQNLKVFWWFQEVLKRNIGKKWDNVIMVLCMIYFPYNLESWTS